MASMTERKIKVLLADDSAVSRMLLVHLLEADPQISVVGTVKDGQEALDFVRVGRPPDVILMDIHMPRMDGFEATRLIMETRPVPIVICSAHGSARGTATAFRALEAGAIACIEKPFGREQEDFDTRAAHMLETVKLMSEVRVVRRTTRVSPVRAVSAIATPPAPREDAPPLQLVGIGASTGGPPVLQTILAGLPKDFAVPILVVQHIAQGFLGGMAEWLTDTTGRRVLIAAHNAWPLAGHVYLAPDDFHMGVGAAGAIVLSRDLPTNYVRPAVSYLFRTLAEVCGPRAVGVLLTGMGRDGAQELKELRDTGAVTIVQDQQSSVVHGMPGAAIALGGATHVLPADRIAAALVGLAGPAHRSRN